MTAPKEDLDAPVPSLRLSVTGPMWVIVAPALKVSPKPRSETTLVRYVVASLAASVTSLLKMYGLLACILSLKVLEQLVH